MHIRARRSSIVFGLSLVVGACTGAATDPAASEPASVTAAPLTHAAPPPPTPRPFVIIENPEQPAARTPDGCITLEINKQWHSLRYRRGAAPSCPSFNDALPRLREMVSALHAAGHLSDISSFDVSRDYTAYFERLALTAAGSADWSRASGKPKQGTSNAFVVSLTRDGKQFYPEIVRLLEGTGLTPELRSVEKVLVGPASQTPFASTLTAAGIAPTDQVPYDCIVVFHLVKTGG